MGQNGDRQGAVHKTAAAGYRSLTVAALLCRDLSRPLYPVSMQIALIHHVSLTVTDLDRSRAFYREILCLTEIDRPPVPF